MTIKGSGNIADQMLAGKGTMQDLADVLTVDGKAAKDTKLKLASGDIAGEGFAETDENGNVKQNSIRNNMLCSLWQNGFVVYFDNARSPTCPKGVCPRSCPSAIASTRSSFRYRLLAIVLPI